MIETIYLCPSTPIDRCQWEGRQEDILQHFERCHKDFFLTVNYFNLVLNQDFMANYLMHLNEETYLVQFKYSQTEDVAEIRLRFLGPMKKAKNLSYFVEIDSGNFAFTTKNHSDGYSLITRKEGAVLIDVSSIRTICGRKLLDNVACFINIEEETSSYAHRSIRRSFHDSKVLESKVKEIFQRNSSFRSNIRRKSIDGLDFVESYRRRSSVSNEANPNQILISEILNEVIDDAIEESESKQNIVQFNDEDLFSDNFFDEDDFFDEEFGFKSGFLRRFNSLQEFGSRTSSFHESSSLMEFCIKTELEAIEEHETEHVIKIIEENTSIEETDEVILREKSPNRFSKAETEYYEKIQLMRCVNCTMIMIPPIFVCLNGHSVCVTCKPLNCSCKSEVSDMRNIDLEEISRSISHPCRFFDRGCTEHRSCYEIRLHEIKCDYFQYKCPHCNYLGKFNEVVGHVRLLHPSLKIVDTMENSFPRNSDFLVANKFGMFYCTAFLYDNSIEWCVVFTGREKISFSCNICIKNKKNIKAYYLRRNGNTCKSIIHLNELKNSRVKDKHAMLYIRANS